MRRPPLSLNEQTISRHHARDQSGAIVADPVLDALSDAMKAARTLAEQIASSVPSIMADATNTPAANAVRAKATALTLAERATKHLDAARARVQQELKKIDGSMTIEAPQRDAEIRAALSRLTPSERDQALTDDVLAAAAAAAAHPLLSGLTPPQHAVLTSRLRRERYPVEVDRKARLEKAMTDLDRGGVALVEFVKGVSGTVPAASIAEASANRSKEAVQAAEQTPSMITIIEHRVQSLASVPPELHLFYEQEDDGTFVVAGKLADLVDRFNHEAHELMVQHEAEMAQHKAMVANLEAEIATIKTAKALGAAIDAAGVPPKWRKAVTAILRDRISDEPLETTVRRFLESDEGEPYRGKHEAPPHFTARVVQLR